MDPLTAGLIAAGAAQGAAAWVNYYNAQKAAKADAKKLQEIRDIFEKIKPPGYNVDIDAPPKLHTEQLARPEFKNVDFDMNKLTPEDLKVVAKFSPTLAPYIQERAPELIKESTDAKAGRDAQKKALDQYLRMQKPGAADPNLALLQEQARRKAQIEAQSREQSINQDWQRRGMLGSGLGMAQQMQGSASAMDRLALTNMEAARQGQQQRLQALAGGAALGSQMRGQDLDLSQQNAAIINAFNQRTSAGRQDWENQRAGTISDAEMFNQKLAQSIANQNVDTRNKFSTQQQGRSDDLTKWLANLSDDRQKWGFDQGQEERNYSNQALADLAQWGDKEKAQQNTLLGQSYDDQMRIGAAKGGAIGGQAAGARQTAQDQAQAFQGMANVGSSIAMGAGQGYSQNNQYQGSQAAADDRAYFKKTGKWMDQDEYDKRKERY